jgi:hypothetical protein
MVLLQVRPGIRRISKPQAIGKRRYFNRREVKNVLSICRANQTNFDSIRTQAEKDAATHRTCMIAGVLQQMGSQDRISIDKLPDEVVMILDDALTEACREA